MCGKDGNLLQARKLTRNGELGFVGEPERVDASDLDGVRDARMIPVIAPIGIGPAGETYNTNADTVAGAIAAAVKAMRFLLLTDVPGVLDAEKRLIPELSGQADPAALVAAGSISGGMIPKVETCLEAVDGGTAAAVILDGRVPHAILLELFTEGGRDSDPRRLKRCRTSPATRPARSGRSRPGSSTSTTRSTRRPAASSSRCRSR